MITVSVFIMCCTKTNIVVFILCAFGAAFSTQAQTIEIEQVGNIATQDAAARNLNPKVPSASLITARAHGHEQNPAILETFQSYARPCLKSFHSVNLQPEAGAPSYIIDARTDANGNTVSIAPHSRYPQQLPMIGMIVSFDRKGNIVDVQLDEEAKKNYDTYQGYAELTHVVIAKLKSCSPFSRLTNFDYNEWRYFPMFFDPDLLPDNL